MTISTYAELRTAISNWPGRTFTDSEADEFIDLAEGYFNIKLRCREMESVEDLTPSSGICTLPSDYLEYKRVVEKASIRRPLVYVPEDGIEHLYPSRPSGLASHFTIIGSSLYTFPLASNDIELTFYEKIPALSASQTTNWLLTRLPNLYLHACLLMMAEYVRDYERIAAETAFVERYTDMLHELDNRSKFGNAGMTIPVQAW